MSTKLDERSLFLATALTRQLVGQGVPIEKATRAACTAFDTPESMTARYARIALDGTAQARADLAAAGQRTQRLNAAKERRATQPQQEEAP